MGKPDIYRLIKNKRNSISDLASKINIEEYVNGLSAFSQDDVVTYGVNVRLSRESDNTIYPFSFCNVEGFDPKIIAGNVEEGFMIPDFINLFRFQDVLFKVDFQITPEKVDITKIEMMRK